MNTARADAVVRAVLYEGYMLYPYRPSSVKNRQRWTFGGVYPRDYAVAQDEREPWSMQTECLVRGDDDAGITATVGFLHLVDRQAGELLQPFIEASADAIPPYRAVEVLEVGEHRFYTWQEAMQRQIAIGPLKLTELEATPRLCPFSFEGLRDIEPVRDAAGLVTGLLDRTRKAIEGEVEARAKRVAERTWRVTLIVRNLTRLADAASVARDAATSSALVSCHAILGAREAGFVSLMDPPDALQGEAAACHNIGTWPVLVGEEDSADTMLSSPIILYDHPQIAPESPGDLFDATEIDEILTLRILTMTDQEKREMAAVDERSRALLDRTEQLRPEQLERLHGALRRLRPDGPNGAADSQPPSWGDPEDNIAPSWDQLDRLPRLASIRVGDRELCVGAQVVLRPRGRADIMDIALDGMLATIESIERDFENRVHVAVTVNDDPGRDLGLDRMPGHRFFFSAEELEPVRSQERVA